jgi:hypothetical protein
MVKVEFPGSASITRYFYRNTMIRMRVGKRIENPQTAAFCFPCFALSCNT